MKKAEKLLSTLLKVAFAVLCCTFFVVIFNNSQEVLNVMVRSMLVIAYTLPVYLIVRFIDAIIGIFRK
jgi:hypothetical protein